MAGLSRTVRVSGLPTDLEEDRLHDRLLIHFLRTRNGGGEVESVTIVEAAPTFALITFEDSAVAQRLLQRGQHILEIDGKKYKLTVTEQCESLDPDKVILRLSATVDYMQLSGGTQSVASLHESHPGVQISYAKAQFCTLHGTYSEVQAALAQLLGRPGSSQSAENKDSNQQNPCGSRSVQTAHNPQDLQYESGKHQKQTEQSEEVHMDIPSDVPNSSSHGDPRPAGYGRENATRTDASALQVSERLTSEEDFSLMVDADMFQYLQKHGQKEYQHILKKYGVEVVDMTNQGLTTLFLQVAKGRGEGGQEHERLKLSRQAISMLCQENETKICRSQVLKRVLSPKGGLQRAMENLRVRFPKLLLKEDESYIYIIGSSSDVSEARQCLLLDPNELRGTKDDVASLFGFHTYDSGSLNPAGKEGVALNTSYEGTLNEILRSEDDERKTEGARKYKLAARFKDSGIVPLGNRPTEYILRGHSSPSRQTHLGPMLGHDVLSGKAENSPERVSRALAQNTSKDILFESGNDLPSSGSLQNKSFLNSNLMETRPKRSTSPFSTAQSGLSRSAARSPAGSGSTLKRANSFSGAPLQKAPVVGQKSKDDSSKFAVTSRGRSSSFSTQTGRDVYLGEIRVSQFLWQHIKEAYGARVDDLTSEVLIKERSSENDSVTVTVTGASSSKVRSCQLGLQQLIESVNVDVSVQELPFSKLGVTDHTNETLQACCEEVRSRFKKVTLLSFKKSLFLVGPELLCSKVAAILQEVFSVDLAQTLEQQAFSSSSTPSPSLSSQINEDQRTSLRHNSNLQLNQEAKAVKAGQTGSGQVGRTNQRGDFNETELVNGAVSQSSVRKDPVIKEKVKISRTVESDGRKPETALSHSSAGYDKSEAVRTNGVGSAAAHTDKDVVLRYQERTTRSSPDNGAQQGRAETPNTPQELGSGQRDLARTCVCGQNGASVMRTECGVTLCSKCPDTLHASCRVCRETVPTALGIQGKMSVSRLQLSIPGHNKDLAIKITYCIPDGIQVKKVKHCPDLHRQLEPDFPFVVPPFDHNLLGSKGHPFPGNPFQGGVFEAYLPDCEKARKLVPRLEKAFRKGLTFTVAVKKTGAKVVWDCIPHKTSVYGGKSGNGYPDSTYLRRLSQDLTSHGIEEEPVRSQ